MAFLMLYPNSESEEIAWLMTSNPSSMFFLVASIFFRVSSSVFALFNLSKAFAPPLFFANRLFWYSDLKETSFANASFSFAMYPIHFAFIELVVNDFSRRLDRVSFKSSFSSLEYAIAGETLALVGSVLMVGMSSTFMVSVSLSIFPLHVYPLTWIIQHRPLNVNTLAAKIEVLAKSSIIATMASGRDRDGQQQQNAEMDGKGGNPHDKSRVSLQLHNVRLVDPSNLPLLESLSKTFNSASRCAFKRFKSIGLWNMLKTHRTPEKRETKFRDCPMVDEKPREYERPTGMSKEMWSAMRREAYMRKVKAANPFWQIDKDLGSPIMGTVQIVGNWAKEHGYDLDSTLVHNATMTGLRTYKAFEKKARNYQCNRTSPAFGWIEERSRNRIGKEEFQLTKNASITVIGKKVKGGNPKFRFDAENDTMTFILHRKKVEFSFASHRFSKKGYRNFSELVELMNQGKVSVTVTLTRIEGGKFNVTLTYSPTELAKLRNETFKGNPNVKCALYTTDEALCHQIVDISKNKVLHSKIYRIDKLADERRTKKRKEELVWERDFKGAKNLERKLANRIEAISNEVLDKVFKVNKAYGVSEVVVESPRSRTTRNFNNAYIEFHKDKIGRTGKSCYISAPRFVDRTKSQCSKHGMKFTKKANGTFAQMLAVMKSSSMEAALVNATRQLLQTKSPSIGLTDWAKWVSDPSMLDWVRHLLHNKRPRQARKEIRKAFQRGTVERAARLIDTRSSLPS